MRFRFSKGYAALALLVFGVETLIALFVHDAFVRPLVGDALVVVLVHAGILALLDLPPISAALGAFAFACAIEVGQYFHLVDVLHLGKYRWARVVIGTSYDPRDFAAYAAGASLIIATCLLLRTRRRQRSR